MNPAAKLSLDLGPLVVFLIAYYVAGVYPATAIFIVATLIAAGVSYALTAKVSPLMIFSGMFVIVLGGLTIWLQNDIFIKLKPTIYYLTVAGLLFGGLAINRLPIKEVMEFAMRLEDQGWRKLTIRLGVFFVMMAGLNIWVAQTFSFESWLWFKIGGLASLSMIFFLAQARLIERYELKDASEETPKAV